MNQQADPSKRPTTTQAVCDLHSDAPTSAASQLAEALALVRSRWPGEASTAIILGTGLGELASEIAAEAVIPYQDIPHFPHSTAPAHAGNLILGRLGGQAVVAMQGRWHLYEGYSTAQAVLGVRLMHALGARTLLVSNAAGGLNPAYQRGDVMLLDEHLSFLMQPIPGATPVLSGRPARPRARLYDADLLQQGLALARAAGFACHRGVYVAVTGPTYETRAEIRMYRRLGGDCIGMSTVPEVLAAAQLGMRALGVSTVTNVASPDVRCVVTADDVAAVAAEVRHKVLAIVRGLVTSAATS